MPKDLIQKNIRLSHELDRYISNSSSAFRKIPKGVHVVITSDGDKRLSDANMSLMRNNRGGRFIQANKSRTGWTIKTLSRK